MTMGLVQWKGTHSEDWSAWAAFHRELSAHEGGQGNHALAEKHEEIARKYDCREARETKRRRKAAAA